MHKGDLKYFIDFISCHTLVMRILSIVFRCQILVLLALLWPTTSFSATYIKPDPSEEMFRLEKIPLQVDRMKELSRHLVILSKRRHNGETVQQRGTAQMLALALRLDPSNQEVRDIDQDLAKGNKLEAVDDNSIHKAKARIRFFKRWLAQPDAGNDANKLAAYLEDATKVLDRESMGKKDLGNWNDVIPPLKRYPQSNSPNPKREPKMVNREDSKPDDDPFENPAPQTSKFHITELSVYAPYSLDKRVTYFERDNNNRERTYISTIRAISKVSVEISPKREDDENLLEINSISNRKSWETGDRDPIFRETSAVLNELLNSRHKNLGEHKTKVTISDGHYARSNQLALTAPLALMLESSITNNPLNTNLHVCGGIDGNGKFYVHENFWASLKTLRESQSGGRLIVPKDAIKLLAQTLVLEKPDFFTRWQVFAVDTLDEAMAVSIKNISSELAEADQLFETVQNLAAKSSVPKLAANKAVRARLIEIGKKSPNHMSSRILLLQGSSKRPRYFNEETLALTLMPAVIKMHQSLKNNNRSYPSSKNMLKTHEEVRAIIDPLVRMVDRSDASLYKSSMDLANDFRSLSILIRRKYDRSEDSYSATKKIRSNYTRMETKAKDLLVRCRKAAGFPDEKD